MKLIYQTNYKIKEFYKMNARQLRLHKMKQNFTENLNGLSIAEYFQIPNIKIILTDNDEIYTCKFHYEKTNFTCLNLPFEINCIVLSYLYEHYLVNFSITIPPDYPFKHPTWNIESGINIPINYKHAVIFQNSRYKYSWSPSITLEKDILNMIEATNKIYDVI